MGKTFDFETVFSWKKIKTGYEYSTVLKVQKTNSIILDQVKTLTKKDASNVDLFQKTVIKFSTIINQFLGS